MIWLAVAALAAPADRLAIDRDWEVLTAPADPPDHRALFRQAGAELGDWTVHVAGVEVNGPLLIALAEASADEPFLRVVRETFRQPVDLDDFGLFLDDVLVAGREGLRGELVWVPAGRARSAGILVHPREVFRDEPRIYAEKPDELAIDRPPPQEELPPAEDGDPPGPNWTARFQNPWTEEQRLADLRAANPSFADRMEDLIAQLDAQGCDTYVTSTVRSRDRGYLMWGAFELGRAKNVRKARRIVADLDKKNAAWGLNTPITWRHPDGWEATIEAARQMADAYDVVYATERGARFSSHYDGVAIDFVALALPAQLELTAPNGATMRFDLADPQQTRDLSLTPEVIDWIEEHYRVEKLETDYPHWSDAAK